MTRSAKGDVIAASCRRLENAKKKECLKHVVGLKCSATQIIRETGLPHRSTRLNPEANDLRKCRSLSTEPYQRLEMVGSASDFHIVFVDVVRAHHWVYETSKMLHRDISPYNIMWYVRDGRVVGVLCDLDIPEGHRQGHAVSARQAVGAQAVVDHGQSTSKSANKCKEHPGGRKCRSQSPENIDSEAAVPPESPLKPRYGTRIGPFTPMDFLCEGTRPPHKYRHDLEAFFYVYIYAAATYDPVQKLFGNVWAWQHESLIKIRRNKRDFLTDFQSYKDLLLHAHEAFAPLFAGPSFLSDLWKLFSQLELVQYRIQGILAKKMWDAPTEDEEAEIRAIEDSRDRLVTYSKFMQILGEEDA